MIRFSLFGIPVGVRPTFWLVALLLGFGIGDRALLLAWVVIVFLSVLAHELGHALTARRFGAEVAVTLTTFGGYTQWSLGQGTMSPGRRAIVAGAGSAIGIVFGLVVLGLAYIARPLEPGTAAVASMVVWVNVGWGVLNWLPIRPLDGGHLTLALLDMLSLRKPERTASAVFTLTGAAAVAAALYFDLVFAALLAGFMTWSELSRFIIPARSAAPPDFSYEEPAPDPDPPRTAEE